MSTSPRRHPFLDDLAEDVTLMSSILRQPVSGRASVLKVVKAGASLYLEQTPKFLGTVEGRSFFEYEVKLADDEHALGLVSIHRNDKDEVTELNITFSPLGSVLSLAAGVKTALSANFPADFFL